MKSVAGLPRVVYVLPVAAFVTVLLFGLMAALAGVPPARDVPGQKEETRLVVSADEPPPRRELRELTEPEPTLSPPAVPSLAIEGVEPTPLDQGVSISPIMFDSAVVLEPVSVAVVSAPTTPLVRIPPTYPPQEAERGTQGRCWVVYDVMGSGETANIRTEECDSRWFARASVRAVERWRHEPSLSMNEEGIALADVRTELLFVLNQE